MAIVPLSLEKRNCVRVEMEKTVPRVKPYATEIDSGAPVQVGWGKKEGDVPVEITGWFL